MLRFVREIVVRFWEKPRAERGSALLFGPFVNGLLCLPLAHTRILLIS